MACVVCGLVYPCSKWLGLTGGQLARLIAIVAGYLFQVARTRRLTGLNLSEYANTLLLPVLVSFGVAAICLVARPFPPLVRPLPNIMLGVVGCLLAYSLSLVVLRRKNQKIGLGL
jgi:hypothetical protein